MSSPHRAQELLRAAQVASGLSARDIARRAGLSHGTVSNALNGTPRTHPVPEDTLRKLAKGFGIPYPRLKRAFDDDWNSGRLAGVPDIPDIDVPGAILSDPKLLPEARAHLLNQYELLLRLHPAPPDLIVEQERRRQEAEVQAAGKAMLKAIPKEPPAKGVAKAAKKAGARRRRST